MKLLRDTFKALSDETRLQIMTLLLEQEELCVCDFVGALGQTQSKVSRHLRYLYNAGLVQDRREGLWMHYRISPSSSRSRRPSWQPYPRRSARSRSRDLLDALEQWFARKEAEVGAQGKERQPAASPHADTATERWDD